MKTSVVRSTLIAILMLGLAAPSIASAGFFNWGCRYQGTWLGVMSEDNQALAGWMVTVEGKFNFYGTNNLEATNAAFDPRIPVPDMPGVFAFETAVQMSTMRGNWMRTGYNQFIYTTTGFGLDANGFPLYIAKLSGHVTLGDDCNSNVITGIMEVFLPGTNPFIDEPPHIGPFAIPNAYGYRAFVDLP